jgi:hypothetical protein
MPNVEQIIRRGQHSALRDRRHQDASQSRAEEQVDRKAARLQRFEVLDGRNRALGERAEQLLSRYKSLTEYALSGYAYVLLKEPVKDDSKMWPMGVLRGGGVDRYSRGARYTLGTFATDSSEVVHQAQVGELYGGGPWQHGLEEENTYKISDDLYAEFMTHIPTMGLRFAAEKRVFAPVKALQRVRWAGVIDRRLTGLEGTMDLFEGAAADVQLNPGLAQSLEAQAA